MRTIFFCLMAGLIFSPAWAEHDDQTPSSQPPPIVIGSVLGEKITKARNSHISVRGLKRQIMPPLIKHFQEAHEITATDEEIENFIKYFKAHIRRLGKNYKKIDTSKKALKWISQRIIMQWKTSRALYETFGGTVVFQQANPLEPVGAYEALVRQALEKGTLKLQQPYRSTLLNSYDRDYGSWVVKPENIDFSTPWWTRELPQDEAASKSKSEQISDH